VGRRFVGALLLLALVTCSQAPFTHSAASEINLTSQGHTTPAVKSVSRLSAARGLRSIVATNVVSRNFQIFRSGSERVPLSVAKTVGQPLNAGYLKPQRLPIVAMRVWAVVIDSRLCLLSEVPTDHSAREICSNIRNALTGGLFFTWLDEPGILGSSLTIGLVSDGTRAVTTVSAGTPSKTFQLTGNVFMLQSTRPNSLERLRLQF
jgi:hypothetical protein